MKHISTILLSMILTCLFTGCGHGNKDKQNEIPAAQKTKPAVIEHAGTIEAGDPTDANHANLAYDAFVFNTELGSQVEISVKTKQFDPLLKLVEVATGAVLSEWDPEYSEGEGLTYTIAGTGKYEARIYAMKDGTGAYTLTIKMK